MVPASARISSGILAAIAGLVDFLGSERIRSLTIVWYHFASNAIGMVLTAVNLYFRTGSDMIAVTGWLGGELVFRHGAGVIGDEPAE